MALDVQLVLPRRLAPVVNYLVLCLRNMERVGKWSGKQPSTCPSLGAAEIWSGTCPGMGTGLNGSQTYHSLPAHVADLHGCLCTRVWVQDAQG